jgi:phosphoribosylformimino-5-aminoimidazole carboxamide ribotide isomerase
MRLIGVIDLLGGRAVHARGGQRERYAPVEAVGGARVEGDPRLVAARYRALGLDEIYVADLDAIGGLPRQEAVIRDLSASAPLWLDAGVSSAADARECLALGAALVIVGLETLASWEGLADVAGTIAPDRVAFSLDLRDGQPIVASVPARAGSRPEYAMAGFSLPGLPANVESLTPEEIAARAADAGAGAILVLDLARVGLGAGPDVATIERVRERAPHVVLLAGGGVRDADDLQRLAGAGCDGALVATALHTGRIGAAEIAAARHFSASR